MFVGSVQIISGLDSQSKFQIFILFSGRHVGEHAQINTELHQHGGSMLGSVNLRKTFRRKSQVWKNADTQNLEKCRFYLCPIT